MPRKIRKFLMQMSAKKHIVGTLTIFVLMIMIAFSSMFVILPETVQANPGPYDDWSYYKQISIANANNSYQMFINVTKTSGGDVNCSDHCLDTFADVRFSNIANDTGCDYWIENYSSGNWALFWVELPSDVENDNTINMYYGKANAISESNGSDVFYYFDNWTVDHTGDWYKTFDALDNDTFWAVLPVSGVQDWGQIRIRFKSNRSWIPADPHLGLRVGTVDNDTWDADHQYPDNAFYCGDAYVTGFTNATRIGERISIRDNEGSYSGSYSYVEFTPAEYRVWDILLNESTYNMTLRMYDTNYNLKNNTMSTVPSASWADTSLFDSLALGAYHDAGITYFYHEPSFLDGVLRVGGSRDGDPVDLNILSIDWMFLGKFNSPEPTVSLVSQENAGSGAASVYIIKGLPNDIVTWAGTAGTSVYCNSTGDTNEWLEINMSINATDNVTEIRVFMDDLNDTGEFVNASNITMYVANASNTTYYSFGAFTDGGSNITINQTTWNTNIMIDNPFNNTGLKDTNTSIFLIFKLAIPAGASTDIFWSSSLTNWKIYFGHYA